MVNEKSRLIFTALTAVYRSAILTAEHRSAIYRSERVVRVDAHIRKVYVPMTETGFYILLCLGEENHGYGIIQRVEQLTGGEIRLSPGTMYGSLSKMEKDGLIAFVREEDKRKLYRLTDLGRQVLELESRRIARLYRNMREARGDEF
jgi:DNA-binding PadR family transcriptional regulator